MRRGRKSTPTVLKLARGNPGKRPVNQDEPKPEGEVGDPPALLTGDAKKEWERLCPQLEAMGVLTSVDVPAFAAYCKAWARYVDAENKITATGEVVKSPSGYPIQNPYRAIANKAYQQCREFWSEFGMTASARTRVQAKPRRGGKTAADARKERFFGGLSRHA